MDSFYWIVLTLASLILIGLLAFIGWTMSNQKKGTKYPTVTTTCPDNWKAVKGADNKVSCQRPATTEFNAGNADLTNYIANSKSTGYTGNTSLLDFDSTTWGANGNPVCAKREWAQKYDVKWDSVENANYC